MTGPTLFFDGDSENRMRFFYIENEDRKVILEEAWHPAPERDMSLPSNLADP
jgi:hypothetical protein